mmetsp:Transcript_598/g.1924  ORF Transcript_598/g.1924 Transcript_598/m.1924 type:complete len:289 (-) Transcript_598:823-1689(-)
MSLGGVGLMSTLVMPLVMHLFLSSSSMLPVKPMMGMSAPLLRSSLVASIPPMMGISMSMKIKSKAAPPCTLRASQQSMASLPLPTTSTLRPIFATTLVSIFWFTASSSTIMACFPWATICTFLRFFPCVSGTSSWELAGRGGSVPLQGRTKELGAGTSGGSVPTICRYIIALQSSVAIGPWRLDTTKRSGSACAAMATESAVIPGRYTCPTSAAMPRSLSSSHMHTQSLELSPNDSITNITAESLPELAGKISHIPRLKAYLRLAGSLRAISWKLSRSESSTLTRIDV